MSRTVQHTSHQLMCEMLIEVLHRAVQAGPGADGIGSVPSRAVAALYTLLMAHPIDRRGRCRSCRRPGAVLGRRWRRCRVHGEASLWLHQPADFLRSHLTREIGLPTDATQSPAAPSPPVLPGGFPRAGRPDPPEESPPQPPTTASLLLTGSAA